MPKFRVKGCFKENSEDVEIIIEATSYKDAQRIANQKGIVVSDVLTVEEIYQEQRNRNYQSENDASKSNVSRTTYVLTGILIGFLVGIYGVHNLIAGYQVRGIIQISLSIFCWFMLLIGIFLVVPLCLALPVWIALLVWTVIEVCTVTVDSQGRSFS
jgi:TM2 domain-containing membrane protein YozV